MLGLLFLLIVAMAVAGYALNRRAALSLRRGGATLHSLPGFHGGYSAALAGLPAFVFLLIWLAFSETILMWLVVAGLPDGAVAGLAAGERSLLEAEIRSVAAGQVFGEPSEVVLAAGERLERLRGIADMLLAGLIAAIGLVGIWLAWRAVRPETRARQRVERILSGLMVFCSVAAILTTFGIVASLVYESLRFFDKVSVFEFLFGTNWEPQIAMRADQVGADGAFGWIPVFVGTLLITCIALVVAIPTGIFAAIYLNEFASKRMRDVAKPLLEILAGIPTVVYGFFAILVVTPAIRAFGDALGLDVAPNTALSAGGVMGIMLIPFISSFADDALSAVPRSLRDGSLAMGATQSETVLKVLFPAALPGIVGGVLLAVSRAIGETMIVVMAAGILAKLTFNPLDSVTTVTVQIVTLLIGDTEFDNPKTLAAFALGLMLFIVTLVLNVIALRVVRRYREVYE